MITVYKVLADLDNYQFVLADRAADALRIPFDGTPIAKAWKPPASYSPYPIKPAGDFWGCYSTGSVFAVTKAAARQIVKFLDESCERLPLTLESGEKLVLCNVTEVVNCLDKKKSKHKPGCPDWIDKYEFHPRRLGYSLFKIPESRMSEVLCVEGIVAPADGFKGTVEKLGLTGLEFKKVWEGQKR